MIVRSGGKYVVKSHDGTKTLGTYDSKAAAEKRLGQIEMFKAMRGEGSLADELMALIAGIDEGAFDNFMGGGKMGAPKQPRTVPPPPQKRPLPPGLTKPKKPPPPEGKLNPAGGFYERIRDLEQLVAEADSYFRT